MDRWHKSLPGVHRSPVANRNRQDLAHGGNGCRHEHGDDPEGRTFDSVSSEACASGRRGKFDVVLQINEVGELWTWKKSENNWTGLR